MSQSTEQQPRIEGAQVWLQPFVEADVTPVYLGWLNDPVTTRYSNQRFARHTRESSLAYLRSFVGSPTVGLR